MVICSVRSMRAEPARRAKGRGLGRAHQCVVSSIGADAVAAIAANDGCRASSTGCLATSRCGRAESMPSLGAPGSDKRDFSNRRNQTSFSSATPEARERARQIGSKSPVRIDPKGSGRKSWELRSATQKDRMLAALLAAADHQRGGQEYAALCRNPNYVAELLINRARLEAIRRGEEPPGWFRIVPCNEPTLIKKPGYTARKKRAKRERELAAQQQSASQLPQDAQ